MRGGSLVVLSATILILTAIGSGRPLAQDEKVPGPVPATSAIARVSAARGKAFPFPWSGVDRCLRQFQPGCFVVTEIAPLHATLTYARFELDGGTLKPQGFRYRTPVTPDGSGYELFPIKLGGGREEWVYATMEGVEGETARIQFLKLPAFVTDRAHIRVNVTVKLGEGKLEEAYAVRADEPITLIGLGDVDAVFPSARLETIEVNGLRVILPHPQIVHLNLPIGSHRVVVRVGFGIRLAELTLQGTILEPRRMALIQALDLRVDLGDEASGAGVEVRTVGLPPQVWDRFRSTLAVAPVPVREELAPLAVRYRFGPSRDLTFRTRPRIPLGPNNYPVMITIAAPSPK